MPRAQDKTRKSQAPGLRMNELMALSGLSRSTILYYLAEGLLPAPLKTSRNMAYYAVECVERLNLIKALQSRQRLPLEKIRHLLRLRDQGQEIAPFVELMQVIFGLDEQAGPLLSPRELARQAGLSQAQVAELVEARLLLPLGPGGFDQQDLAMAKVYAGGLALGLTAEDMAFYPRLGAEIVKREMRLRRRVTAPLTDQQNAATTLRLVQAARATRGYVIDRLFQREIASRQSLSDPGDAA
jgi:DNA-binding transcriptional MerR regulator